MAKKARRENFRVEVYPRAAGDLGFAYTTLFKRSEEETERLCRQIAEQIRRHVDGLPSSHPHGVYVVWDDAPVCEFCGSSWTEDDPHYNGGCCEQDEQAHAARTADSPSETL